MKRFTISLLILGILLLISGLFGIYSNRDWFFDDSIYKIEDMNFKSNMFSGNHMDFQYENNGEKLDIDNLIDNVESYISYFEEELEIDDIFIYEDSDYYVLIVESDTRLGAMELLVNPYTGNVYPEYGPNMMWNLKYSQMGHGMMGRSFNNSLSYSDENEITLEKAHILAKDYTNLSLSDKIDTSEVHEFYGYYTFHLKEGNETVGMLSVNVFTGEVWYHNWHGKLIEIIEGH